MLTGERVAIKNIKHAFDNDIDAKRTVREVKLLRQLQHENIIGLRDLIPPQDPEHFNNVYAVYELMDTDLHQIIKSNQLLTDDHCQYFIYQVLRGLRYIHSANILHRDLKPSNLLLNANCDLKICDFGLARSAAASTPASGAEANYTEYVVTRYYRAPELLLQCREYTAAIDVWSVGCIFAELLGRKPFFPGKDQCTQLHLIMRVLGTPAPEDVSFATSTSGRQTLLSLPYYDATPWSHIFPNASSLALDLLDKMLQFNPDKRITVDEALQHPYLGALHDINDEPVCEHQCNTDFEREYRGTDDARRMILEECISFHPNLRDELTPAVERLRHKARNAPTPVVLPTASGSARVNLQPPFFDFRANGPGVAARADGQPSADMGNGRGVSESLHDPFRARSY